MPPTKPRQDREEKRAELVLAARDLFLRDGYDGTSMAALARAAGVAPNTIYWYFGDKDDVLVAVLDGVLRESLAAYGDVAGRPLDEQLRWTVEALRSIRRLVSTVHARIAVSPAVDAWHDGFHAATEALARAALADRVGPEAVEAEVRIAVFVVEGLLAHDVDDDGCRAICDRLAARWT